MKKVLLHLKNALCFGTMLISLALIPLLAGCKSQAEKEGFVVVKGGQFYKDGKPFRFVGTNNYYLHYSPDKMIDDFFSAADEMKIPVVRCWGFQFGPHRDHNSHGMDEPGEFGVPEKFIKRNKKQPDQFGYPRDIFERLDYTIAQAKKHNIRLVIALNNYWGDFGGIQNASSWQRWFNLESAEDFYTNEECKKTYKEYISYILNRVNTYTNIAYKDDPTVMTWEVMNEPRDQKDKSGATVTKWVEEMSAYIKSIAPKQLCAVGDEGFMKLDGFVPYAGEGSTSYDGYEGEDFDALLAIKSIDYGTFHLYPETWGILDKAQVAWGDEFIRKHAESGRKAKKPVVLEEYGTSAGGNLNRKAVYDIWNNTAYKEGLAGSMFWILTSTNSYESGNGTDDANDGLYDDYDGFRILNDKSEVATLLSDYSDLFAGKEASPRLSKNRVYLLNPARDQDAKGIFEVRAQFLQGAKNEAKVKRAELYINGEPAPSPRTLNYNAEADFYRLNFDTLANAKVYPDGSKLDISVLFTFDDGTQRSTETHTITIANVVTYSVIKKYDFANDEANASSLGGYMAELKEIKHTTLNGGMVEIDGSYSGENNWEELKIKFGDMSEVAEASKIEFTLYYEKSKMTPHATKSDEADKLPGFQPYIAFDPGWVKTGLKENNRYLKDTPVVTLEDGKEYYKLETSLEFFQNPGYTFVTICPTLGYVKYDGAIYIDDVILYKKD